MKNKQALIWIAAMVLGVVLGVLHVDAIDSTMEVIATIFVRLFQLLAIPTIAVAVIATMTQLGKERGAVKLFRTVVSYTFLTTLLAAAVGVGFYYLIAPGNLSEAFIETGDTSQISSMGDKSYLSFLLNAIPSNLLNPLIEGNVLAVLLLAFAIGIGISCLSEGERKQALTNLVFGAQDLLFMLIKWLIAILPIGIVAFSAQLARDVSGGEVAGSLGSYILVILAGNLSQMFIVLPLFLLAHKVNPIKAIGKMSPALITAFFTKSSAATLPLTISTAESRMGVPEKVSRFVLPICTTINMNGCAAFIAVTSMFVMQNAGIALTLPQVIMWVLISVIAAIGNAGVPMGCYFLTLSLMSGVPGSIAIMSVILPVYTIIDMVETSENVWSDSCVAIATASRQKANNATNN